MPSVKRFLDLFLGGILFPTALIMLGWIAGVTGYRRLVDILCNNGDFYLFLPFQFILCLWLVSAGIETYDCTFPLVEK